MSHSETCEGNETVWQPDRRELFVMDIQCNVTALNDQTQMNSNIFFPLKMTIMCVSCALNTLLSAPLLLAILRSPSLLRHTRYLLLTHLLFCDNLQQILWTIKSVLLGSRRSIPVTQCLIFCAAIHACSLVALFLSTTLAVDRFVAIRWPLRYEPLMSPNKKRATLAAIWTISAVFNGVALYLSLKTIKVSFSLQRCRTLILTPCLSGMSTLVLFCNVETLVVVPLCFLTILGCFCVLCWDMRTGLLCTQRGRVTLGLQVAQIVFFSVPVVMDSNLIPSNQHSDALDIATTLIYNLGASLIRLVYGYRSRELQQRIRQAAHRNRINSQSQS